MISGILLDYYGGILFNYYIHIFFVFSIFLFIRIIAVYAKMFLEFMFNQKCKWYDKEVEKPRLLFNIIAFIFLLLAFIVLSFKKGEIGLNFSDIIGVFISTSFFCLCILGVLFSWSPKFKNKYMPQAKSLVLGIDFELCLKSDLKKEEIIKNSIENKCIAKESESSLVEFLDKGFCQTPIIWTKVADKSKAISNIALFNFVESVSAITTAGKVTKERKGYINFLTHNFKKAESPFSNISLNQSYTNWTPPK